MKESIGSTFLYNMIFVYIIIVFGLLTATMNYYKGYKVNTRIISYIKQYSGYNSVSHDKIEKYLSSIGYKTSNENINDVCSSTKGSGVLIDSSSPYFGDSNYLYCVYYFSNESNENEKKGEYYGYGVTSFIFVDLPIIGNFKLPVYSKSSRIYNFDDSNNCQPGVPDAGGGCK